MNIMSILKLLLIADNFWKFFVKTLLFWIALTILGNILIIFMPEANTVSSHPLNIWAEYLTTIAPFSYFATYLQHRLLSRHTGFKAFTDYVVIMIIMLTPLFFVLSFFKH